MSRSTRSAIPVISSTEYPTPPSVGPGVGSARSSRSRVFVGDRTIRPARLAEAGRQPGEEDAGDQRDRWPARPSPAVKTRPEREPSRADVQLVRGSPERPADPARPPVRFLPARLDGRSSTQCCGRIDDRAERDEVCVRRAAVVHRRRRRTRPTPNVSQSGATSSMVPAERLLALVDAGHDLEAG